LASLTIKLLIQELWKLQIDWDESLPSGIFIKWSSYVTDIQYLNEFGLPRRVIEEDLDAEIQLDFVMPGSELTMHASTYKVSIETI